MGERDSVGMDHGDGTVDRHGSPSCAGSAEGIARRLIAGWWASLGGQLDHGQLSQPGFKNAKLFGPIAVDRTLRIRIFVPTRRGETG